MTDAIGVTQPDTPAADKRPNTGLFKPSASALRFLGPSVPRQMTFSNVSGGAITVHPATVTGPDADRFTINTDGCIGASLSSGGTCTITLFIKGTAPARAMLEIPSSVGPAAVRLRR